ncbi:MAG: excisionase family DNA-binding protein [Armatimonadota bacterium]|nr:helix-turn-helix domain-containing protein [Armatimonadota bacterium]MDW8142974.1 excisionase family DNA-binding protein [Armatimonadota bacterium]
MSIKVGKTVLILLTEAERKFGVSRETLRRAAKRGEIEVIRVGRNALVKPEEVAKWVATKYRADMAERIRKRWQKAQKSEIKKT